MAKHQLFFFFFFFFFHYSTGASLCSSSRCPGPEEARPPVRFPFRLRNSRQPPGCSYNQGFDLSCHLPTFQTTLDLPPANDIFIVQRIDYEAQTLYIDDPNGCLPQHFLHRKLINLNDTPFRMDSTFQNYTFLNCSTQALQNQTASPPVMATSVSCLGSENHTVLAAPSTAYDDWLKSTSTSSSELLCTVISSVLIPTSAAQQLQDMSGDVRLGVRLTWSTPDCRDCETGGGDCGFNRNTNRTVCSYPIDKRKGLPRSAKYGIIIGVGIPGLLCILGLASYVFGRIKACGGRRQPNMDLSASVSRQPAIVAVGLDGPTIESYPKTLLGESKRLPKPNDNTCSICLSEYQPKEELRTIPECNHYFHASCIDEWLKMNATCPMCRNSPEGSSFVTPSSSTSSSTFSLASPIAIEIN